MKSQLSLNSSGFLRNPKTFLMFNLVSKLWMFSRMFGSFLVYQSNTSMGWLTSEWGTRLGFMAYRGITVSRPRVRPVQHFRTRRSYTYNRYRFMRSHSLNKLSFSFGGVNRRHRSVVSKIATLNYRKVVHPYFFDTRPFRDSFFSIIGAPYRRRFRLPRRVLMFPHYSMRLTRYETFSGSGRTRRWAYRRWLVEFLQENGVDVEHGVSMFVTGAHKAPRPAWFRPYGFATTLMGAADAKKVRLIPALGFSFLATHLRRRMCRRSRFRRKSRFRNRYAPAKVFSGVSLRQFRSRLSGYRASVRTAVSELRLEVRSRIRKSGVTNSEFLLQRSQSWLVLKGVRGSRVGEFGASSKLDLRPVPVSRGTDTGSIAMTLPGSCLRRRRSPITQVLCVKDVLDFRGGLVNFTPLFGYKIGLGAVRKRRFVKKVRVLFRLRRKLFRLAVYGKPERKPTLKPRRRRHVRMRVRRKLQFAKLRARARLRRTPERQQRRRARRAYRLLASRSGLVSSRSLTRAGARLGRSASRSGVYGVYTSPVSAPSPRGLHLRLRRRRLRKMLSRVVRPLGGDYRARSVTARLRNSAKLRPELLALKFTTLEFLMARVLGRLSKSRRWGRVYTHSFLLHQGFPRRSAKNYFPTLVRLVDVRRRAVWGFDSYRYCRSSGMGPLVGFLSTPNPVKPLSVLVSPGLVRLPFLSLMGNRESLSRWLKKADGPALFHTIKSPFNLPLIFGVHGFMYISTSNGRTRHQIREIMYTLYSFSSDVQTRRYLLRYFSPTRVQFDSLLALSGALERRFQSYSGYTSDRPEVYSSASPSLLHTRTALVLPSGFNVVNKLTSRVLGTGKPDRIQFKPGYSRMWRRARTSLQVSLGLTLRYQYRLTRLLLTMYRTSRIGTFRRAETRLASVLVRSSLAAEESHADMLVESGSVFINGSQVCNGVTALFTNDFVQLIVNVKYYMAYRHVLTSLIDKHRRVAKLARYKYSPTSWQVQKQRSNRVPRWVQGIRFSRDDVPKYLEVDYFTLSIFMLYDPFLLSDFSPLNNFDSRDRVINMYNWKYIN